MFLLILICGNKHFERQQPKLLPDRHKKPNSHTDGYAANHDSQPFSQITAIQAEWSYIYHCKRGDMAHFLGMH